MRFQPGHSGNPRGRPYGSRNKRSLQTREDLWAYIAACGEEANPFKRLVDRMVSTDSEAIEIACAQALADRLLPKLKAVEVSGDPDNPIKLLLGHLDLLSDAELHRLMYPDGKPLGLPHAHPED